MAVNKNKKQTKPEDKLDALMYSMQMFNRLFNKEIESDKEFTERISKMTKEQLIGEVLQLKAQLKDLLSQREQDNTIAKAIREGMQQVAFSNSQSGLTVDKSFVDTAMSKVTMETTESTNNKIRAERERMSTAYRFIQELEKYKAEPHKEMFNKNMDKFININPYDMSAEYLEQMIDAMQQDIKNQGIFNYGWNEGLSRVFVTHKARKFVDIPKFREMRLFLNKDELCSKAVE